MLDRATGRVATLGDLTGFEAVYSYNWLASGERIEFKGHRDGELRRAVFDPQTGEILDSDLPRNIFGARFSSDGSVRAGLEPREPRHRRWGLYVDRGPSESEEPALVGTEYTGWALSPDGARVAYTEAEEGGWGALYLLDLDERRSVRLASDLDLSYTETPSAAPRSRAMTPGRSTNWSADSTRTTAWPGRPTAAGWPITRTVARRRSPSTAAPVRPMRSGCGPPPEGTRSASPARGTSRRCSRSGRPRGIGCCSVPWGRTAPTARSC